MTLPDFLLARYAEIEVVARAAMGEPWHSCDRSPVEVHQYEDGRHFCAHWRATAMTMGECAHIALHDPAHVLADIESKRRIIKSYREALDDEEMMAEYNDGYVDGQDYVLRLLALPFADHPDFDESWRP